MGRACRFLGILLLAIVSMGVAANKQSTLALSLNTGNPAPYGEPSININIQGKTLPVIFDTGTSTAGLVLTHHALEGLNVTFTGKKSCMVAITGKKQCLPQFIIPKLSIGSFVLTNVTGLEVPKMWAISNPKTWKPTEASRDGTIGYSAISQFNVLLDYQDNKITLYDKSMTSNPFKNWIKLPFDNLFTVLFIDNQSMIVFWDTGSMPSIIAAGLADQPNVSKCVAPFNYDNCNRFIPSKLLTTNDVNFPKTWFEVANMKERKPFDATIGSNFYLAHQVFFDFATHTIYIKPGSITTPSLEGL